jgi:hypothetical protein
MRRPISREFSKLTPAKPFNGREARERKTGHERVYQRDAATDDGIGFVRQAE